MSKNFELLQHVGNEEELFQAACQSVDAVAAKNGNSDPELDKEAREKILQKASLPDVLRTASETSGRTPVDCFQPSTDLNKESGSTNGQKAVSAGEFRNSRNPSSPMGESANPSEHGMTQSVAKSDSPTRTFSANKKPKASSASTNHGSCSG
jgi:hypothetical protein